MLKNLDIMPKMFGINKILLHSLAKLKEWSYYGDVANDNTFNFWKESLDLACI